MQKQMAVQKAETWEWKEKRKSKGEKERARLNEFKKKEEIRKPSSW